MIAEGSESTPNISYRSLCRGAQKINKVSAIAAASVKDSEALQETRPPQQLVEEIDIDLTELRGKSGHHRHEIRINCPEN